MALGAAYEDDAIQALANSPVVAKPAAEPKFSAWQLVTAPARALTEAAAQRLGGIAEVVGGFGQVLGAYPEAAGYSPTGAARRQADEQRQRLLTEGVEMSNDIGDALRAGGRVYRPDPQTSHVAEQVVYGFVRGAGKLVADTIAMGPAGPLVSGVDEAMSVADDLRLQGVDLPARAKAGAVQGAGLALAALPIVGQTKLATAGLYAIGGPGGFMAQQLATREILQSAGYEKIGEQFDPFDPIGLTVATLLPAGFAGYGLYRQKLQRAAASLPDLPPRTDAAQPADPAAPTAPFPSRPSAIADAVRAYPTEAIDAARVVLLAERRAAANPGAPDNIKAMDQHEAALTRAEDQLAAGEPVQVADVAPAPDVARFQQATVEDSNGKSIEGLRVEFDNGQGGLGVLDLGIKDGRMFPVWVDNGIYGRGAESGSGRVVGLYEQAIREAQARGLQFTSDDSVTPGASRVYDALQRRGYAIERNPAAREAVPPEVVTPRLLTDDGSPVYRVTAAPADQPATFTQFVDAITAATRPTDAPTAPQAANPEAAAPARGAGDAPAAASAADAGRLAGVEAAGLTPKTDAQIGAELQAKISADFDAAVVEYSVLPDAGGGKILNTDTARELSPDYLADRTKSAAVHEPASQFIKDLYARKLKEDPKPGEQPMVLFTAGGTGAGKTSAIVGLPSMAPVVDQAQIIYDTNMNGYASSRAKIDQALAAGKDVRIVLVVRDPADALVNGALPRAENQRRKFGTGRTVPLREHIRTHIGALETVQRLADEFADHTNVRVRIVDNSLGKGKATERDRAWLRDVQYNDVEQRVTAALESEYAAGRISAETYRGFAGKEPPAAGPSNTGAAAEAGRVRPDAGPGVRQGAEPAGPEAGLIGSDTSAITERGLTVPLRYRLAEAGDLTTSHTNDLTANPAFPAELQPRDRARAASAEQISRIENAIRPELLGESVKASDGAPIVGPDGVVESGNARTIALRRAYDSGKADAYRAWLADNVERFGLTRADVEGMQQPVLVRERLGDVDRAEFARQANESAVAAMSPTEQAMSDARRITDLTGLVANEDGTINMAQSADFVRQFIQQAVAPTERGTMLQASGQLSQAGMTRLRNAVFAKAYGDADILAMLTESTDANVRNILAGMLRAAPEVAKLTDLAKAGARQDADIAGPLVEAVRLFSQLRSEGRTVQQFMSQGSMFDDGLNPEIAAMLEAVSLNARAPKRIAEMINGMVDSVNALGDTRQMGMFDVPEGQALVAGAAEKAVMESRLTMAAEKFPALEVMMDGMEKPMPMAEFLAAAKAEADDLAADAPLMQIAAECALLNSAG